MAIVVKTDETQPDNRRAILGAVATVIAICVLGILYSTRESQRVVEQKAQERMQQIVDRVRQGDSSALILESRMLRLLANDSDCKRIVTRLDFASTEIDPEDAKYVSALQGVSSIGFYCTKGTSKVLAAARSLPIRELYFEMPDLSPKDYAVLADFPNLEKIHFEHIVENEWIEELRSALPGVTIEAPFLRSKEQTNSQ